MERGNEHTLKIGIIVTIAVVVGVIIGSTFAGHRDAKEIELRAHSGRALFRVAERHVGHERLIVEWREEVHRPESTLVAVLEINGQASR